jgi:methylated-DNA-[protein]-cysteine S-methyltransferase
LELIEFSVRESSLGNLVFVARNGKLIELDVSGRIDCEIRKNLLSRFPEAVESSKSFRMIQLLLDRYLRGQRVDFDTEVDLSMEREFTRRVLVELRNIPYGHVTSYGRLAKRLGYRNAARAVGQALARNPIPIIIPCHRVIREDSSIGGFSLGLKIKKRLLALEGIAVKD